MMWREVWGVIVGCWALIASLAVANVIEQKVEIGSNEWAFYVWYVGSFVGCIGKMAYHTWRVVSNRPNRSQAVKG